MMTRQDLMRTAFVLIEASVSMSDEHRGRRRSPRQVVLDAAVAAAELAATAPDEDGGQFS